MDIQQEQLLTTKNTELQKELSEKTTELEAKTRELEIEAALERIRGKSMAMQKSEELQEVIRVVYEQLMELNVQMDAAQIDLYENGSDGMNIWVANELQPYGRIINIPEFEHPMLADYLTARSKRISPYSATYPKADKDSFYRIAFKISGLKDIPKERKEKMLEAPGISMLSIFKEKVALQLLKYREENFSDEEGNILKKITDAFEQAYIRFLDLQKAEAQAREAQIEASLERVRAHAMGLRNSNELQNIITLIFEELQKLGLELYECSIFLRNGISREFTVWAKSITDDAFLTNYQFLFVDHPLLNSVLHDLDLKIPYREFSMDEKELKTYGDLIFSQTDLKNTPPEYKESFYALKQVYAGQALFQHGFLEAVGTEPLPGDLPEVLRRFTQVIDLTYTRFLDLQKAEAQTREAEIQLALERVHAKTMAMHQTSDLLDVGGFFYREISNIGIQSLTSGIVLIDEEADIAKSYTPNLGTGKLLPKPLLFPIQGSKVIKSLVESWKKQEAIFKLELSEDEVKEHYGYMAEFVKNVSFTKEELIALSPTRQVIQTFNFKYGYLLFVGESTISTDHAKLMVRFAKVFEQTYTRFLDLQKAEAQVRESQIETALEKVRSRTMAMQKSEELLDLVKKIYSEIEPFGVSTTGITIALFREDENAIENWFADNLHSDLLQSYKVVGQKNKVFKQIWEDWKNKNPQRKVYLEGPDKRGYDNYILTETDYRQLPEELKEEIHSHKSVCFTFTYFKYGYFESVDLTIPAEENAKILLRFAKVFEQTYTRFLDLQKAEAQAHEAQIETALEKVRSRSLAMHNSDELKDVVAVVFEKLMELGFELEKGAAIILTFIRGSKDHFEWIADPTQSYVQCIRMPYYENPLLADISNGWEKGTDYYSREYSFGVKNDFFSYAFENTDYKHIPDAIKETILNAENYSYSIAFEKNSAIGVPDATGKIFSEEKEEILKRFARVFEQAYIRFLDLQKAETQAREAQIEAALERVRSRTMGMHQSSELSEVGDMLFQQIKQLGIDAEGSWFWFIDLDTEEIEIWVTADGKLAEPITVWGSDFWSFNKEVEGWKNKEPFLQLSIPYQEARELVHTIFGIELSNQKESTFYHLLQVRHKYGFLGIGAWHEASEEEIRICSRFAKVFEQTYTRFLDLQKAEAQAREAQIEAALERVRSKAMAMQNSADLNATIGAFYRELEQFSITPRRCGLGLLRKNRTAELSTMNTMEQGNSIEIIGKLKMEGHWVLDGVYDNWILQKEFHPVLRGNEIKEYNQLLRPQIAFPEYPNNLAQHGYFFFFPEGGVYAWTEKEMKEDELNIYRKFTTVLSLTYKRYKDLKDAEANAREAVRRASLDRVRAEIASMRTVDDLQRITPIIWHELTVLGVPFVRCGVFIMNEETEQIQVYLSAPDGHSLAALDLSFHSSKLAINTVDHWRRELIFKTHWDRQEFINWMKSMIELGQVSNRETYQGAAQPPESLHLHFVPFKQGMLYVGNSSPLEKEALELVKALAESFSIAFARYEDFKQLETAKNQIEKTLSELKSTQSQLIQSEKMASLGELTAGIAHEIQNPLNFVNNFSELSNELLQEMKEELATGNLQPATELADDVIQNLEKINHHGKRADAIVKGMLQHSRTSNGIKEPTDINALADEYLRLSYHGLRAKDKSFNADFKTDFDPNLPKINVIPQDIGRVLLNLINNAFYAVDKRAMETTPQPPNVQTDYYPTVIISTTSYKSPSGDLGVEIRVKDNANGIPESIKDKIFQPFFTTKPTGQGTGLGLSLSYDIVKAHGGELKVQSTEGEGSEFIIQIPNY